MLSVPQPPVERDRPGPGADPGPARAHVHAGRPRPERPPGTAPGQVCSNLRRICCWRFFESSGHRSRNLRE